MGPNFRTRVAAGLAAAAITTLIIDAVAAVGHPAPDGYLVLGWMWHSPVAPTAVLASRTTP